MKRLTIIVSILLIGLSSAVYAANTSTGTNSGRKTEQEKADKKEARRQKRKESHEAWLRDMENFNSRQKQDGALNSLVDSLAGVKGEYAMKDLAFVLEANYVTFRQGMKVSVDSGTNFISLDGDKAVVQISPNRFAPGPNGMGGVTVEGTATGMQIGKDKKGNLSISMNVTGIGINASIEIKMTAGTNRAYATVDPNFNSNTIYLDGRIVPYSQSRVIEGMSL